MIMWAASGTAMGEGRCFEDFALGQTFNHAPARTVSDGDASLHLALTGSRFPLHCSAPFAQRLGLPRAPLDGFLVFNLVFGQTVADISLNAVANLGYACGLFGAPVYAGDTLLTSSVVTGLRQTSAGDAGLVYVHTKSVAQDGRNVLSFDRWVMVKKRDHALPAPTPVVPTFAPLVPADYARLDLSAYDFAGSGSALRASELKVAQQIEQKGQLMGPRAAKKTMLARQVLQELNAGGRVSKKTQLAMEDSARTAEETPPAPQ